MTGITYIGSCLGISAGAPATETPQGYQAKSFVDIGNLISIDAIGDTAEDVSYNLLKGGRTKHVNGVADVGSVSVSVEYNSADAQQNIVRGFWFKYCLFF